MEFISFAALRHHTLSQLRQLQDVEGFGKILMGLRNVKINDTIFLFFGNFGTKNLKILYRILTKKHLHR